MFNKEIVTHTDHLAPILQQVKQNNMNKLVEKTEELRQYIAGMQSSILKLQQLEVAQRDQSDDELAFLKKQTQDLVTCYNFFQNYLRKLESRASYEQDRMQQLTRKRAELQELVKKKSKKQTISLVKYFRENLNTFHLGIQQIKSHTAPKMLLQGQVRNYNLLTARQNFVSAQNTRQKGKASIQRVGAPSSQTVAFASQPNTPRSYLNHSQLASSWVQAEPQAADCYNPPVPSRKGQARKNTSEE